MPHFSIKKDSNIINDRLFTSYTIKLEVDPSDDSILGVEQIGCPWENPDIAKDHLINALKDYLVNCVQKTI